MRANVQSALKGAAVLFSTIVGAGVLGLPAALSRIGLVIGTAYLLGVGFVLLAAHLALGDIFQHARGHTQIAGVVRRVLGRQAAALMFFVFLVLHLGALVAYLIGEGESLASLFGGEPMWWTAIFFVIAASVVYRGTKTIAAIDMIMSSITIVVLLCFGIWGIVNGTHLPLAPHAQSSVWVPLGVLLFAFHGTASVAEVHAITARSHKAFSYAVMLGSFLPIILYTVFVWGVLRVTGLGITEVATQGLGVALGRPVAIVGNLFAALLMGTTFVTIGLGVKRLFEWDFGLPARVAWALAVGIPALIYALGARAFVEVIAVVGGTCGTIELVLIALTWWRIKQKRI